jgi:hypothetical protein
MGPAGGGKTTLVERLLEAGKALCLAARCVRDASADRYKESFPKQDSELRRYRRAGAVGTARLFVPEGEDAWDDFYSGGFMENYSEAVLLEGDSPVSYVDLRVFVARPVGGILIRGRQARTSEKGNDERTMRRILDDPENTERILTEMLGAPFVSMMKEQPSGLESIRKVILGQMKAGFPKPAVKRAPRWSLAPGFRGIETAQVVVANVRSEADRTSADLMLADLKRIREDKEIGRDVLGIRGTRISITAVVANLADPGDPDVKKVVRRIQRSIVACAR